METVMSRTYRRKKISDLPWWVKYRLVRAEYGYYYNWLPLPLDSEEYKKALRKFRSESGTTNFKEPGPHWFRNLFTDRPARRATKRELQKFMLDEEYEPMILPKNPLKYWT